jgi:hypothetical protein
MTATLEEANKAMRRAVKERLDNTPSDDPKVATSNGPSAAEALARFYPTHPTSQRFYDLCDRLKAMHASKSTDYGCPSGNDPLANIRNGATFVGIEPWKGAMVRLSDKVTRLATFNATGRLGHEGVEDTLLDLASYSLLALLLYQEEHDGAPDGR